MKELIKKLMEANRMDALDSVDAVKQAAAELGVSEDEVEEFLEGFEGFPLDDDELNEIVGGKGINPSARLNRRIKI